MKVHAFTVGDVPKVVGSNVKAANRREVAHIVRRLDPERIVEVPELLFYIFLAHPMAWANLSLIRGSYGRSWYRRQHTPIQSGGLLE